MELQGLMPWSSNYTFLVSLSPDNGRQPVLGIYKPCAGERPLWDFPEGSLCQREFASYLLSRVLGWPNIPLTVLRDDGPQGAGAVQLFIGAEYELHYFNMREEALFTEAFKQIALFDYVVNNADRKAGHCLKGDDGQLWAIDHGLTFHADFKLRTVIWDFCRQRIPAPLVDDLTRLQNLLAASFALRPLLRQFISRRELDALKKRVDFLLTAGHFPDVHGGRSVPYPPI